MCHTMCYMDDNERYYIASYSIITLMAAEIQGVPNLTCEISPVDILIDVIRKYFQGNYRPLKFYSYP